MNHGDIDPFMILRLHQADEELSMDSVKSLVVRSLPKGMLLSAEERLALFHLVHRVYKEGPASIDWSVHQIAKLTNSNIASVGSLVKKLKQWELIVKNPIGSTSHRSRDPYVLTSEVKQMLRPLPISFIVPKLRPLQHKLLFHIASPNGCNKKRGGFSRSNRWLLVVLLEFADNGGVVDCLSNRLLMSLTGMTSARLSSQLQNLICLGFLHSVSPGTIHKNFMSIQHPVYYLNTLHPFYEEERLSGVTLLMYSGNIDYYNDAADIDRLNLIQKLIQNHPSPVFQLRGISNVIAKKVPNFAGRRHQSSDLLFIEGLVSRLTSGILKHKLSSRQPTSIIPTDIELFSKIQKNWEVELAKYPDFLQHCKERLNVYFEVALLRYKAIYPKVMNIVEQLKIDVDNYDLVVLPIGYVRGSPRLIFAVEMLSKETNKHNALDYRCIEQVFIGKDLSLKKHKELSIELRRKYGFIDSYMEQKASKIGFPLFVGPDTEIEPDKKEGCSRNDP